MLQRLYPTTHVRHSRPRPRPCYSRVAGSSSKLLRIPRAPQPCHLNPRKMSFTLAAGATTATVTEAAAAPSTQSLDFTPPSATRAPGSALSFNQTQYQEKARKLVTLVNQLRDAGAQFNLDLPCMVVCGNQSAGKSSLLERLCGVKLPRAAGTCTKCPTEVRLSTSPPGGEGISWCCKIKLRKEYGKDNRQLASQPKEQAFKTLTQDDKDYLHFYISAAQRALLNPDTPADIFVREADAAASLARMAKSSGTSNAEAGSIETSSGAQAEDILKFTRNVIVLEITGADVDLALIDLPGIIQSEQRDDGSNVELVKQLVEQYISSERAIIVATITCKDDIDNQQVVQMARAADKEGHRTIGVLTKADTIEPGTHHTWLPVLQGITYPLRLGYFCVVNPSQKDLDGGMSQQEAAIKEENFFKHDTFFGSNMVATVRGRFGVEALRVQLSQQLVALTQRELPKMKQALEDTLAQTEQQLLELPPPPASDPNLELFRRLRELSTSMREAVDGRDDAGFYRNVDNCYLNFRDNVLAARPAVRLTNKMQSQASEILQEEDPEFWLNGPQKDSNTRSVDYVITLEKARELAARYRVREMPTFAPYRVLEELVQPLKGRWDAAALACLHYVGEELQALADDLVEESFGQFATARQEIRSRLYELHGQLLADTELRVRELLNMEKEQTWTQNDHYLASSKQMFLNQMQQQLYDVHALDSFGSDYGEEEVEKEEEEKEEGDAYDTAANARWRRIRRLQEQGLPVNEHNYGQFKLAMAKLAPPKSFRDTATVLDEGLLEYIAGTLAYFKVSSKRVIDGVPMHLRHYLLLRFCKELEDLPIAVAAACGTQPLKQATLTAEEQPAGSVVATTAAAGRHLDAAQLMAEDRSTAERRAQLKHQMARLQDVRKILSTY